MDSFNKVISAALMIFVALFLMFKISSTLTIVTLILFILFGVSQKAIMSNIMKNSTFLSQHMADFSKLTIQSLEGLRLIHTYHRQNKVLRDISTLLDDIAFTSKKLYFWNHSIPSINEIIGISTIGSVLVASLFIFDPSQSQGVSLMMTFLILAYRASTRMQIAFTYAGTMTLHLGPLLRLNEILKDEGKEFFPLTGQPFHKLQKKLEFRSVWLK